MIFVLALVVTLVIRTSTRAVLRRRRRVPSAATAAIPDDAGLQVATSTGSWHGWTLRRRRAAAAVLAMTIFGAGVGADRVGLLGGPVDAAEFGLIREAWDLLYDEYVEPSSLDSSKLAHAAIRGMADAVGDTGHTAFLTPDEAAAQAEELEGSYVGVGIELDETGVIPVVSVVVAGGPAAGAGLRTGDRLLEIDGRPTQGMTDDDLTNALRGEAGTNVTVIVERAAASGTRTSLTITRGEVTVSSVDWAMVPGTQIAFISLTVFSEGVSVDLYQALVAIDAAGATGLVLDLRGNPGGWVNEGVDVASEFLASGVVLQARDRFGVVRSVSVNDRLGDKTTPLVVLIDAQSASASEVVASALQDAGRAILVGERTSGTGTGIADFSLDDGSVLSIGTIEWLTRSGRSVWHTGVTPDIAVTLPVGVLPSTPADVSAGGTRGVESAGDTQLLAALKQLGYRSP